MSRWPLAELGNVCEIIGGGTPSRSNPAYFGGDIPWATPTDVTGLEAPEITLTRESITPAGLAASSAKLLPAGSVLLTSRATIGFTAVTRVPMATNQGFANLIPGPLVTAEFLALWLPTQKATLLQLAGGTTFKEISKGNLRRISVPLPPLDEQRRIVDLLNRAAGIRRLREAALAKARETIPALFLSMFGDPATNPMGWTSGRFGSVVAEFRYGTSMKCHDVPTEGSVPVLRIPNVVGDAVDWTDLKFAALTAPDLRKLALRAGDILFVRTNGNPAYIGRAVVCDGQHEAAYASYLIRARLADPGPAIPQYVREAMTVTSYRDVVLRAARTTAGNYNMSVEGLSGLPLPFPPLDLQHAFAERLADLRSIITQQERALTIARDTERALMARLLG